MKIQQVCTTNAIGTSLQGYLDVDFATLKRAFGKPMLYKDNGAKIDAEWVLRFNDEVIVTIYNYKDGKNYCGSKGTATTKIRDWHIGGKSELAVNLVNQALREYNRA